jgi:sarcosine oxidase subunit alpha
MSQPFRTDAGGRIDRTRLLRFSFDGRRYSGHPGDTLASALLANDVHLAGRSFKYHRPRGIFAAGVAEPNALVTIDRGGGRITPNLRATEQMLFDGLAARSQNRFPSLRFDVGAVADYLSPLLAAGFVYRTFKRPRGFWHRLYEPAIRAAAGLGRAPAVADPDSYLQQHAHCEVLVIGGGPAGLAAALAAAATGVRVILCDEQAELGGSLLAAGDATIDGTPAADWLQAALQTLASHGNVTLLARTTAFGCFPGGMVGLVERVTDHLAAPDPQLPRERLWQVRAAAVVLAAGAIAQPLVFPDNDRPGVMLADAALAYLRRYGVKVGGRVVLATSHDSGYGAAHALQAAGVTIAAIADTRAAADSAGFAAAHEMGLPVFAETTVTATSGRLRLRDLRLSGRSGAVACDTLLTCGGWTPSVHLFSQARGRLRFDAALGAYVPAEALPGFRCVGACAGIFAVDACIADGFAAGEAAARGPAATPRGGVDAAADGATDGAAPVAAAAIPPPPARGRGKAFVDLQNDVTVQDLRIATREGFHAIEHIKRYTTAGMATDQGKTSQRNTLAAVAGLLQRPVPQVGHTTFRMPYTPVTFGALVGAARGALLEPVRRTPLHDWAALHGAVFEPAGAWQRARCYPVAAETIAAAVARECRAVRQAAGILDASTLGKIEVVGPDAAAFLDLICSIDVSAIAPGRACYTLLLNETGFVMDDGVVARLTWDRFHVTTTTAGATALLHHMEDYRQTEFPQLRVWLTDIQDQYAVIAVQGPAARAMVASVVADVDLAAAPPMSVRACSIGGVPARLCRVSFTGEAGYELHVPAGAVLPAWEGLLAAGAVPYGTDAMHVLRAEKGIAVVGQETDGTVTADDLGLGRLLSRRKRDFVGKRSQSLPELCRGGRRQLVGLLAADPRVVLQEGAQLVAAPQPAIPAESLGHVTSAYWSETLQRGIALALVADGRARIGGTLHVALPRRSVAVQVVSPVFHDPQGTRVRAG